MAAPFSIPKRNNIQGLVFYGWSRFHACHLLYQFSGMSQVNRFIAALLPYVQSAEDWGDKKPPYFINMSFTFTGLKAAEVPMLSLEDFPIEFRLGPTNYYSQQTLCDLGTSDPSGWVFGNADENKRVDCIVHAYGTNAENLAALTDLLDLQAGACNIQEVLPLLPESPSNAEEGGPTGNAALRYRSSTDLPENIIHFGYRDGINEPSKRWPPAPANPFDPETLNNFLIGYPGSRINPGPSQEQADPNPTSLFAKDGIYNAFRVFYQDVGAFERFLTLEAPRVAQRLNKSEAYAKEWLAAKLNGRWKNGSPLVLSPEEPDEANAREKHFDYREDAEGRRCPFSAHTRNTNPRNQEVFRPEEPQPKVLRRGAPYGRAATAPDYTGERGLIGMFLCGSLGEQFEKMYSWINVNNFSPVFDLPTQDALIANRLAPNTEKKLILPMEAGEPLVFDMQAHQFVSTRGTAYCFLPSLESLTIMSQVGA